MPRKPPTINLPPDHAQQILDYLIQHPYAQVHHLVSYLLAAQPVEPERKDS